MLAIIPKNWFWFTALVLGVGLVGGQAAAGWTLIILFILKLITEVF